MKNLRTQKPTNLNRFAAFDLVHYNDTGIVIGGERFEYRPNAIVAARANNESIISYSDKNIIVFPNPASSYISLLYKNTGKSSSTVEIFDSQGNIKYSKMSQLKNTSIVTDEIIISDYASGLYLLTIRDQNGRILESSKFIKI